MNPRLLLDALKRRIRSARSSQPGVALGRAVPVAQPGVFGRIHPADLMIGGYTPELVATYVRIGRSGYAIIESALAAVDKRPADVKHLLDFGCGYGRVLRAIVQHVPPKRVSVFDVDPGAAEFCATEFGVRKRTFGRPWDWRSVGFERYDLIWAGSVLTHLAEPVAREMLSLLHSILMPGGLLVATTLGETALQRIAVGYFGARTQALEGTIRSAYAESGYFFLPYEPEELAILPFKFERPETFGCTWLTEQVLAGLSESATGGQLRMLRFIPAGWEHVQDVVVWQRQPTPGALPPPDQRA